MNFFEQQAQAHRESKKLLILFVLAVIAIVIAVNVTLAFLWIAVKGWHSNVPHPYPHGFFFFNSLGTLLLIGGGSLYEMAQLRDGGDAVAQMAGGRLLDPGSKDIQERRLLNIVEEMSLASGIACPRVYVMDEEDAINAFAAGYHQNEAVVAVTRGTLTRLNRDELQGVIGHEFSHILNGDMRMNVKLIGVLFGIQMLARFGQILMNWGWRFGSSRDREEKGLPIQVAILLFGVALFAIGYIGIFFGRLIKSAVSRQREFLADASAVQFTRNPDGIGGALRKIGGLTQVNKCGSRINNPRAEQLSHMFLGAARPNLLSGMFATHPPLKLRLQRVYGKNVEFLDASELPENASAPLADLAYSSFGSTPVATSVVMPNAPVQNSMAAPHANTFGAEWGYQAKTAPSASAIASKELLQAARDPQGASALVYAMLLDKSDAAAYEVQLSILRQSAAPQCAVASMLHESLEKVSAGAHLPLLDLSMPALKILSDEARVSLLGIVSRLIAADQRVTQFEFVLQTILQRRLSPQAGRAVAVRFNKLSELKKDVALLLSLMAHTANAHTNPQLAFLTAAQALPDVGLQGADLLVMEKIDFFEVKQALERINQLAPLAKPFLIRLLLKGAGMPMTTNAADLLRSVCAAIDAPAPEEVNAAYAASGIAG
jgi:Zn-dependent protease with chaperone function